MRCYRMSKVLGRKTSHEAEIHILSASSTTPNWLRQPKEELIRKAALMICFESVSDRSLRCLQNLSQKEWTKLLRWLDISGLALYFIDRMEELQLCNILPP